MYFISKDILVVIENKSTFNYLINSSTSCRAFSITTPRGKIYAINELTHPTRTITSSIRVTNRPYTLVSVKTDKPIPKDKMFDVMKEIDKLTIEAPTVIGQVVKANILGLDSNIIITKNID